MEINTNRILKMHCFIKMLIEFGFEFEKNIFV